MISNRKNAEVYSSLLKAWKTNWPQLYAQGVSLFSAFQEIEISEHSIFESRDSSEQEKYKNRPENASIITDLVHEGPKSSLLCMNTLFAWNVFWMS